MIKKLKLEELNRTDIDSFKIQDKNRIILILDNVRSALNVGSVFRTCDAFAAMKICLVGITPVPPHADISKSAIGATKSVDFDYFDSMADCLTHVHALGYTSVGLEQTTESIMLQDFSWPEYVALIVGNEVNGISDEALPLISTFVEIPQFGTKHSLNVSVATGLVVWDFIKQSLI